MTLAWWPIVLVAGALLAILWWRRRKARPFYGARLRANMERMRRHAPFKGQDR